jgi:hypothetical protein
MNGLVWTFLFDSFRPWLTIGNWNWKNEATDKGMTASQQAKDALGGQCRRQRA